MGKIIIELDDELHKVVKKKAVDLDMTQHDLILRAINNEVKK